MSEPGLGSSRCWRAVGLHALCWFTCAALNACEPHTDIVAHLTIADATPEAGCSSAINCDAAVDAAVDAAIDATVDAGCDDAADCGMQPIPNMCAAKSCSSVASRDAFCSAAQSATVVIGDSCDLAGRPGFQFAVCTCDDLITNSGLQVDSLDDNAAPAGASVAINDELRLGPDASIDGSLYVTGKYGATTAPRVSGAFVQGSSPRCGCDPTRLLDITAMVQARARDNDDASAQLTAASLNGFSAGRRLSLDCGRYYFNRIAGSGQLQIEARGRISVFVAGDVALDDGFSLTLQNGATAEIFVGGNVLVGGRLELSPTNDGNRVLLAVQGTGTIDLADALLDGSLYAPHAHIVTASTLELHGSLFVNRANFGGTTHVRYQPLPAARAMCAP
jgi:hypothetical protein